MNIYENLLQRAPDDNIYVYENFDLNGDTDSDKKLSGLYIDGNIALDKTLGTSSEKACVLAEELGHHYTSYGNILNIEDASSRKQERQARLWGFNKMIGLTGIIRAFEAGCQSAYEAAEFLDVTEEYLLEAIECYRGKYGIYTEIDNYIIYFLPHLAVLKMI